MALPGQGSSIIPWIVSPGLKGISAAGTASRRSGIRAKSERSAISISARARFWPRHWWMPKPNAMWWRAERSSPVASGDGYVASSRLIERGREDDAVAGPDRLSADLDVLLGHPQHAVRDGQEPHQLLDGGRHQARLGPQLGQLLGVLEQGEGAERDHVGGRLVAGDQQDHDEPDQLLAGPARRRAAAPSTSSSSTPSPGFFSLAVDQLAEVLLQLVAGVLGLLGRRGRAAAGGTAPRRTRGRRTGRRAARRSPSRARAARRRSPARRAGPAASIASSSSSTIRWMSGRSAATRLTLKLGTSIRRWALCSGSSTPSRAALRSA